MYNCDDVNYFSVFLEVYSDRVNYLHGLRNPEVFGLGGLGVKCSPPDPTFPCSNPTEVDGFFEDEKILSTSSPGGTLS